MRERTPYRGVSSPTGIEGVAMVATKDQRAPGRLAPVLAALDTDTVHRAAGALTPRQLHDLSRGTALPAALLRSHPTAGAVLRRRLLSAPPGLRAELCLALVHACNEDTIARLGPRHVDPSVDDMLEVLDPVVERWGAVIVAVMLAAYVDLDAPCAAAFSELLDRDERFDLAPVCEGERVESTTATRRPPVEDRERQAERSTRKRNRRERGRREQLARERAAARLRQLRRDLRKRLHDHQDSGRSRHADSVDDTCAASPAGGARSALRAVRLVGSYDEVSHDDPLVGAVVITEIRFRGPIRGAKHRPCAVIAAVGSDRLVVRPCYSVGGLQARRWKSYEVRDLEAAGLAARSWISDEEFVVARRRASPPIGRLARDDWNHL